MNKMNQESETLYYLSLHEVSRSFGISTKLITEMIDEGIIHFTTAKPQQFDQEAMRRIRLVLHLQQDLGVNIAGAGLAIELLAEIDRLRALLR